MGMDRESGWSSLEGVLSEEAGKTAPESKTEESSEGEKSSTEEADLLGREISNLSPFYSYKYMSEEEAVSKVKLLKMKIKQLKRQKRDSINQTPYDKKIKELKDLKEEIIENVVVSV